MNSNYDVWSAEHEAMIANGLINNDFTFDSDPVGFGADEIILNDTTEALGIYQQFIREAGK